MGPVQPGEFRELILRDCLPLADFPDALPDGPVDVWQTFRLGAMLLLSTLLKSNTRFPSARTRFYNNKAVIEECFRKLGQWIASCHAKDLAWVPEYNVHFAEVVPGRGEVDYATYLKEISKLPVDAPLMLEHLKTPEEYDEGRAYIQRSAAQEGISFA